MARSHKYQFDTTIAKQVAKQLEAALKGLSPDVKRQVYADLGDFCCGRHNEMNSVEDGKEDKGNVQL